MPIEATFDDKAVKALLKQLKSKTKQVSDKSKKFVDLLSVIVFRDVIDHFDQQKGSGGSWTPWSKSYRQFMARIGKSSNKILQDSGKLRNSFSPKKYRTTKAGIVWYNNAKTANGFPYAYAHNEGGQKLPKRDFMWLSDKAINNIQNQLIEFLES